MSNFTLNIALFLAAARCVIILNVYIQNDIFLIVAPSLQSSYVDKLWSMLETFYILTKNKFLLDGHVLLYKTRSNQKRIFQVIHPLTNVEMFSSTLTKYKAVVKKFGECNCILKVTLHTTFNRDRFWVGYNGYQLTVI